MKNTISENNEKMNTIINDFNFKNRRPNLIIKPEPVDGRWSVPGLSKNVSTIMGRDPHNGDVYAFITKSRDTVHLLTKTDQDGSMADLKLQSTQKIDYWPEKKTDKKDEVVVATGEERTNFLMQLYFLQYIINILFS